MSNVKCACGHVIRDQDDGLAFKARLLADEDEECFWDGLSRALASLVAAIRDGGREEWIADHFGPEYPRDVDDAGLISDFMSSHAARLLRCAYQCEHCGRLLLEELKDANRFRFFVPADERKANILRSRDPGSS